MSDADVPDCDACQAPDKCNAAGWCEEYDAPLAGIPEPVVVLATLVEELERALGKAYQWMDSWGHGSDAPDLCRAEFWEAKKRARDALQHRRANVEDARAERRGDFL